MHGISRKEGYVLSCKSVWQRDSWNVATVKTRFSAPLLSSHSAHLFANYMWPSKLCDFMTRLNHSEVRGSQPQYFTSPTFWLVTFPRAVFTLNYCIQYFYLRYFIPAFCLFVFFCFVLFASLVCDTHITPVRRRWQRRGRGVVEGLLQGCTNFPRVQQTLKKSRRQKGETKQVPYRRPTNIRRHSVKCSRQVCAPVA